MEKELEKMNSEEYGIVCFTELTEEQKNKAIALFVDGFYNVISPISRKKETLRAFFKACFVQENTYVCLCGDTPVGITATGDWQTRAVRIEKKVLREVFGCFKGSYMYLPLKAAMTKPKVSEKTESYIDFITTDANHRGKGIATMLISHVCRVTACTSCSLDVLSKNTNAKRLYEKIGFKVVRKIFNPLALFSGMGMPVFMRLEVKKEVVL